MKARAAHRPPSRSENLVGTRAGETRRRRPPATAPPSWSSLRDIASRTTIRG